MERQPLNLQNGELKEYQLEALNWLIHLHSMSINGILADEMGLGKTIQTISLLAYLNLKEKDLTHLIIVPKVTIKNWEREIKKWIPSLKLLYFYGDKDERKILVEQTIKNERYDIILTTFECSMKEKNALSKIHYEYVIIDEAHRIKNDKAKFSLAVREFRSKHRLLLTGTPFQNNLHELWSLLNFLMPNIFNDSEEFDRVFNLDAATNDQQMQIVKQIHKLLRPFVLRRLKSEVEFKLPPKKEIYLYVGLSELQKDMYKKILSKNIDVINGVNKDRFQLLNILMQLKKVCNHPYLFPKVEQGPPFIEGEHLIYNSMKLKILDVLLKKIHEEKNKVLIFSQMTTLLNILDDYCRYRGFEYVRIDGQTSSEDRDTRIEEFQRPESSKWIFLISTRAGGLGINLHAANIVILYDSDWNPQVDLQAIDRAHRIGQTKPVTVYRFVCEGTVEEKIVERAAKKLKIDHLIIQKGKNVQNKVSALEMTNILQYGTDKLFSNENNIQEEKSIEEILEYSLKKTETINSHLKAIEEKLSINDLSLSNNTKGDIYQFEGEDYKKKIEEQQHTNFVALSTALGQRERKFLHAELIQHKKPKFIKTVKRLTGWRAKAGGGYMHQFYDYETLDYLDEKEKLWKEYLENKTKKENESSGTKESKDSIPEKFTKDDEKYREELLSEGFKNWTKKDFSNFLRGAEENGLENAELLCNIVKTKTLEEVEIYIKTFKEKIRNYPNGNKIMSRINKFEQEKNKNIEYQKILDDYFNELYEKHYEESKLLGKTMLDYIIIPYDDGKKKKYSKEFYDEFEDKYLIALAMKYGYKNWNPMKYHILNDPLLKFNINLRMKSETELQERISYLLSLFKSKKKKIEEETKKEEGVNTRFSKKKLKKKKGGKKLIGKKIKRHK
ncbi:MAG: SNF2-related protein [archaeon]|nr:SNF2-related protein [archaeon]